MRRTCLAVVLCAVIAGGALRFARLSSVPVGLYCDEAFQGYEAYCLISTGADSRGVPHPLFFDIFDVGWEEPLYIYLTTLPVKLLGTTEAATRAVAAASGTLGILAVAWLAHLLSGPRAAAAAAAMMAVSPWAFHFSRVGFQATLLPLFLAAGAAAWLKGCDPDARSSLAGWRWMAAGAATMAAALYTYVAARLLAPLLLAGLAASHAARIKRIGPLRSAALALAVAAVSLPVLLFALTPQGLSRYQDVGLASRFSGVEAAGRFISNYVSYLSPGFLLADGDPNLRHSAAGFGMLHPHDLLFLLAGLAAAALRRRPGDLFMLWWLAVSPVPASLAADPRHAVRALGAIPALYALAGCGAAALMSPSGPLSTGRRQGRIALALILMAGSASALVYLHHYFVEYPTYSGPAWQYGLKQAYEEVEALAGDHDSIYVTRAEDFPFIHRLYLFAFPPREYQAHKFSGTKYLFDEPVFYRGGLVKGRENPLFLLKPDEIPASGILPRRAITNPDGSTAFVIAW
jgi:dolichyl-phosphate-mannose-protein mannosyltransferase